MISARPFLVFLICAASFGSEARKSQRRLNYDVGDECAKCPFDTFYFYEDGEEDRLRPEFVSNPSDCVLAPIRDMVALRGAQSAVPAGKVALTQGYFPFDDLVEYCKFSNLNEDGELTASPDDKTDDCVITDCGEYGFEEFFDNWEGSSVPKDRQCWRNVTFPIPCKKLHVAIGGDGALRPVSQINEYGDEFTGAVYECCPLIEDICNVEPPAGDTRKLGFLKKNP